MTRFLSAVRLTAVAALLAVGARGTQAQVTKPMSVTISGGLSEPTGNFSDFYDGGYNIAGGLNFQQKGSPVSFRLEAMFNQFKVTDSDPAENDNILSLTGNVVVTAPNIVGPYLIGGIGIYSQSYTDGAFQSSTNLGVNVGAGYRFSLGGLDAFAEARWHQADSDTRFIPISFGVIF